MPGEKLSDRELYEKCRLYGGNARMWAKKFAALLPEVERRRLYAKYGFYSIFEFAAKLAGMGRETVLEILRVARRLEDKPLLKAQMAKHGWAKLKVVAGIATTENEKILVEKVQEMSLGTLSTFVKEIRQQNHPLVQNRIDSADSIRAENGTTGQSDLMSNLEQTAKPQLVHAQHTEPPRISIRMPLKPETELRLRQLQKKLSREQKAPVDFNEVMEILLDSYEKKSPKHAKTAASNQKHMLTPAATAPTAQMPSGESEPSLTAQKEQIKRELPEISSRYIPVKVKKFITAEHAGRCAYPGCQKLPEIYHHTRRFALFSNHDPDFLAPLCKNHERLAHHGLIENEERPPKRWQVKTEADKESPKYWIDRKVNEWRAART